jgi:phosphopantetheinyl transferase
MAVHLLQHTGHYRLGIWKMEEPEAELQLLTGLNEPASHTNPVRRLEYLAVRALAVQMGVQAVDIAYLPSGKPYLKNSEDTISISHTKGYVALLLSPHARAGVDVEQATDRVRRIRNKFMHPDEEQTLSDCCGYEQETIGLLLHWCAKESLFKAVPEEGVDFASELRILGFTAPAESGTFSGVFTRTGRRFRIDYLVQSDFVLTCSFSTESK